jgi:PAP2 superfamily
MNTLTATQTGWSGNRHVAAVLHGFYAHRILYGITFICLAAAFFEALALGAPTQFKPLYFLILPIVMAVAVVVAFGAMLEMVRLYRCQFQGSLLPELWKKIRDRDLAPQRLSNAVHTMFCMSVFLTGFAALKDMIPIANPFSWDDAFIQLDAIMHFGRQPYEWLAPVLNYPPVTYVLFLNYNIWFLVMIGFFLGLGFARTDTSLRQRYFIAFMLTWIMGTGLFGTVFSSVGPGLYGRLYPDRLDPFVPLLDWLKQSSQTHGIFTLQLMDDLWNSFTKGHGALSGISAMPSMHVASSILFAICGFATGRRWLGWLMVVFNVLIFLGSIHMGWHYAVDGYAGVLIAVVCWWIAGKITDWDRAARGVA